MDKQIPLDNSARADIKQDDGTHEVAPALAYQRLGIVNLMFVGEPGSDWVLIDAGLAGTAAVITGAAEKRFGKGARPSAIVMTHGHFDHVGALQTLAEQWDVPIYAHELELPYLDGRSKYPPPDPTVGGGMMARMAGMYPRGPVDISRWLQVLPDDGAVPGLAAWRWIHTPGHTPGHVSLWNRESRTIIAGDAFITTRQESAYAVAVQKPEMHGPPMYYTSDWNQARESVQKLALLAPEVVVTGHGHAMRGPDMLNALTLLARDFDRIAVPEKGRYVAEPARADASGVTYIPPKS